MKCRLYYDWDSYGDGDEKCQAHLEISDKVYLIAYGKTFAEAKEKVIDRAMRLPPDEEVEILPPQRGSRNSNG